MRARLTVLAAALGLGWAALVTAAPLDYRLVSGTLVWPSKLSGERRAVVRGDDGITYFLEMGRVDGDPRAALKAGDRVTVLGREGLESGQLVDAAFDREVSALASIPTQPTEEQVPQAPLLRPPAPLPRGWQQFRGAVDAVEGSTMMVVSRDGRKMRVNVADVAPDIREELRPGQAVLVLGPYRKGTLKAQGLVVDHER